MFLIELTQRVDSLSYRSICELSHYIFDLIIKIYLLLREWLRNKTWENRMLSW